MLSKLEKAVEIFKSLGWEEADFNELAKLPLAGSEERKIVLDGLKSGSWTEIKEIKPNTYTVVPVVDTDLDKLAIFAIRSGVDARRAANLLRGSSDTALEVISHRGEKFALDFINFACGSDNRIFEHSSGRFGLLAFKLVHTMNLKVPENTGYIKDWSVYASLAYGLKAEIFYGERKADMPDKNTVDSRLKEHIYTGISLNIPATGPFSRIFYEAYKNKTISKSEALTLIFSALDMAVRPGDRKVWVEVLYKTGIDEQEIVDRAQSLISLLSLGEAPLIENFAPVLIAEASEDLLPEILTACISAKTKKSKQIVLKSVLNRQISRISDELKDWLNIMSTDADKTILNLIEKIADEWKMNFNELNGESEAKSVSGLWQKTPPLWSPPRLKTEASAEELTEIAAYISSLPALINDINMEKFLAAANEVAYKNPEEARLSLAGLRSSDIDAVYFLSKWAHKKPLLTEIDTQHNSRVSSDVKKRNYTNLMRARNYVICKNIDLLPCILSTPDFEDLSIDFKNLVSRLEKYKQAGLTFVYEPDLQLALTRLDVQSAAAEDMERLKEIFLFIRLPDEKKLSDKNGKVLNASEVISSYIKDPYTEPEAVLEKYIRWNNRVDMPASLSAFPYRFNYSNDEFFSIFPLWGDYALTSVRRDTEVYHGQGLVLRQAARRRQPLPKAANINFLAAWSYVSDENAPDVTGATLDAWNRGLLLPDISDARCLDWRGDTPSNLANLAAAFDRIAQEGLLSLIWKPVNDLIAISLEEQRMLAGTAELVKLVNVYLDEVIHAVQSGIADKSALELKAIRALSRKTGSSSAVITAKETVAKLEALEAVCDTAPDIKPSVSDEDHSMALPKLSFEKVWNIPSKKVEPVDDKVLITAKVLQSGSSVKPLVFTFNLPDIKDFEYKVIIKGWVYSIQNEAQVNAVKVLKGSEDLEGTGNENVWLHFDEKLSKLAVTNHRNWREGTEGPLSGEPPIYSQSLLTVAVGSLSQDGDMIYAAPGLVRSLIQSGHLHEQSMKKIMPVLLQNEEINPAKLVRVFEKEITFLPALWVMLTECIKHAAKLCIEYKKPPVWANRVLDICIYNAYYLKEAMKRGYIPAEDAGWQGLSDIAEYRAKSAAVKKAEKLMKLLNLA